MSFPIIASFLFLLLACLARAVGRRAGWIVVAIGSLIAIGIVIICCGQPGTSNSLFKEDAPGRAALLIGSFSCLVVSLLDRRPATLSTTCWSAGLLGLASLTTHPFLLWGAMQFSVLALMFYGRNTESPAIPFWRRHSTLLAGSLFFTAGLALLTTTEPESRWGLIGMVLFVVGLGGILKWFPFPRVALNSENVDPAVAIVGHRLLPVLTAIAVCWRLAEREPFSDQQATLLVIAGLFSLGISSIRLLYEESFSARLGLTTLSLMSLLLVPIYLQSWEWAHPTQDWISSGLPTGKSLLIAIILCEAAGILMLLTGERLLLGEGPEADVTATLNGVARRRPVASLPFVIALCSLSAIPPFPGFWWRFGLVAACLLPHRQSELTQVNERDIGTILLAVVVLVLIILNSLGYLRLLQRVLFESPFRVREFRSPTPVLVSVLVCLFFFLATCFAPLSLDRYLLPEQKIADPIPVEVASD